MKLSQRGLDLIKRFEGLQLKSYQDIVGDWSVGYGHTGKEVVPDMTIDQPTAEALLKQDTVEAERAVEYYVRVPLNQNQFDALVSFVFNVGLGRKGVKDGFVTLKSGKPSTIRTKLNQGDYAGTSAEFEKWTNGGVVGLKVRRKFERQLFEEK